LKFSTNPFNSYSDHLANVLQIAWSGSCWIIHQQSAR